MATEQFANNAQTALASAVDDNPATTSIVVEDASLFPSAVPFRIRIGDELMRVTARSGTGNTTWTVVRELEGTSAAAHAVGAMVVQVLTAELMESLAALVADQVANRVLAGPTNGADAAPTFRALVTADLPNDVVTYAKIQNVSATDKLLGRSSSGTGDVEEIACTAAGRALIDDADASAQRTTLGLGALATLSSAGTSQIDSDAVTDTKLRNSAATSVIGRSANSSGDPADIAASADGQFLRRAGGSLGFGAVATGDLPGGNWITATTASSVLGGTFSITSDATWQDVANGGTNCEVSLTAGTWLVSFSARAVAIAAAGTGHIVARLLNFTDSIAISNSETAIVRVSQPQQPAAAGGTGSRTILITVAGTKTIRMQAWRDMGPTYSNTDIRSDSTGRTSITAVQIY